MIHDERYFSPGEIRRSVRLLVITPVDPDSGEEGPFCLSVKDRRLLLPTTEVDEILCKGAPAPIVGKEAVRTASALIADKVKWGAKEGYHAIVINCMVCSVVDGVQDDADVPVVGAHAAAKALASLFGKRPESIYPKGIHVNRLSRNESQTLENLREQANIAIRNRGADVLTFGCSYLGGAANRLQSEVGVPVIGTVEVAIRMAEIVATLGIHPESAFVETTRLPKSRRHIMRFLHTLRQKARSVISALRDAL